MTAVNTNVTASITANALTKNERAMNQAMERLSTGQRINSASDDAAGLAISSRMTSQINGLNMAVRNANDAISMIQTADGAYSEASSMLQRMRELAVQAASGTISSVDRTALNTEYQALSDDISKMARDTSWNGIELLHTQSDGTDGPVSFQVGANASQTVSVNLGDLAGGSNQNDFPSTITNAGGIVTPADGTSAATGTIDLNGLGRDNVITINFDNGNYQQISLTYDEFVAIAITGSGTAPAFDAGALTLTDAGAITISITAAGELTFTGDTTTAGATFTMTDINVSRGIHATLAATDLTTSTLANSAITIVDTAITSVNNTRATIGAGINRLEYAMNNLSNVSQNTSASRSRVLDADYASETTELARTQIIQQAATAMLSQANQQAQSVLSLLK